MAIFGRIGREIHGDEHQRKALAELFTFIKRQTSPIYGINLIAINIDEMEVIENGQKENEPAV
jgi:hypothetical protein